jgi:hypothetical protein
MGLDMLVLDLVWARYRKMRGEGYIGGRNVLGISTVLEEGDRAYDQRIDLLLVRLKRRSSIPIRHGICFRI